MTANQLKNETARIEALPQDEKRAALPAFLLALKAAGLSDFMRAGYFTGRAGTVHISSFGSLGDHVRFSSAADDRAANVLRARRNNIRRNADR